MTPTVTPFGNHILKAFDAYHERFMQITRRAEKRFRNEDWQGYSNDARERLDLYSRIVDATVSGLGDMPGGPPIEDHWQAVKQDYLASVKRRENPQLAKTFFNSVTRRIFNIEGVNPDIEFTTADFSVPLHEEKSCPVCSAYPRDLRTGNVTEIVSSILTGFSARLPVSNIEQDVHHASRAIMQKLQKNRLRTQNLRVEMLDNIFYRYKEAYLIGRILADGKIVPLVFCILNIKGHMFVDAVLLSEPEVSILFSFAHAYFHVEVKNLRETVNFLKSIIPQKRTSEIYNSLGYHKHGKAELFRECMRTIEHSDERFEIAPGQKGMVMLVFTLPAFSVVFKIIKDHFDAPKKTTPEFIKQQYSLVFNHDRAGRLADIQEFEYLKFSRSCFSEPLIQELSEKTKKSIVITEDHIIIKHLYTQRRLMPMDLYVREKPPQAVKEVMLDYGWAIKELAASNIFPGDLFFKNFGVTRHGRVVFYDYDELSLLVDCHFRKLPQPRTYDEIMSDETWFPVYPNDVFPEEFKKFLRFPTDVEKPFEKIHGDLFDVGFWRHMQEEIEHQTPILLLPYKEKSRVTDYFPESAGYYFLDRNKSKS